MKLAQKIFGFMSDFNWIFCFSVSMQRRSPNESSSSETSSPRVTGIRIEISEKFDIENGIPTLLANKDHVLRLFGEGFTQTTLITFTHKKTDCLLPVGNMFPVSSLSKKKGNLVSGLRYIRVQREIIIHYLKVECLMSQSNGGNL